MERGTASISSFNTFKEMRHSVFSKAPTSANSMPSGRTRPEPPLKPFRDAATPADEATKHTNLKQQHELQMHVLAPLPSEHKIVPAEMTTAMLTANCLLEPQVTPWRSKRENAASMKVFTTVMLHAWRQRREEVRQLQQAVDRLQKSSMKAKNQLHVYTTLMRVEQKRNSELQLQLKQSTLNVTKVRSSCDSLTTSVLNLTADKALLEQEISYRKNEYDALEKIAGQTKGDLFKAIMDQRTLQTELSKEERVSKQLRWENEQLLEEVKKIRSIDSDYKDAENKYRLELEQKEDMLQSMRRIIEGLETKLREWDVKGQEMEELRDSKIRLGSEILRLRQHNISRSNSSTSTNLKSPKQSRTGLLMNRKYIWYRFYRYASNIVYLFWLYISPACPLSNTSVALRSSATRFATVSLSN